MDGQECSIIESGQYQEGEVSWDKTSVPSTLTLDYLGSRLLAQGRYSQVEQVLFEENAAKTNMLGYRVLSGEADDLSDLLSSDLSTGIVTVVASGNGANRIETTVSTQSWTPRRRESVGGYKSQQPRIDDHRSQSWIGRV